MKIVVILLLMIGLAACHDDAKPAAPATKRVDSVVATAPDTIKAMPVDRAGRNSPAGTVN